MTWRTRVPWETILIYPEQNKNRVGIAHSHHDGTLFVFSGCCGEIVRVRGMKGEERYDCNNCGYRVINTLPERHVITINAFNNDLRLFVSQWIGESMHDIEVKIEYT